MMIARVKPLRIVDKVARTRWGWRSSKEKASTVLNWYQPVWSVVKRHLQVSFLPSSAPVQGRLYRHRRSYRVVPTTLSSAFYEYDPNTPKSSRQRSALSCMIYSDLRTILKCDAWYSHYTLWHSTTGDENIACIRPRAISVVHEWT